MIQSKKAVERPLNDYVAEVANALIAFDRASVLRRQELLSIRQSLARRTK